MHIATPRPLQALQRYEQLLHVLRGRRPSDLLPPSPPGYLWHRALQLAHGTCVPAYSWNAGGAWAGRPWSSDLPTDAQLLLYLFAAFIDAPGWEFTSSTLSSGNAGGGGGGGGGAVVGGAGAAGTPLFLGAVRAARPPPQYSAILAYRPEKPGRGVDAVLALHHTPGGGGVGGGVGGVGGAGGVVVGGAGGGGGGVGLGGVGGVGGVGVGGAGGGGVGVGGLLALPGTSTIYAFLAEGRLLALTGYNVSHTCGAVVVL